MTFEDYIDAVREDAILALKDELEMNPDREAEELGDLLFTEDSVTGNLSGSYTCDTALAKEYTKDLFWDEEFVRELNAFTDDTLDTLVGRGPETMDAVARYMALGTLDIEELIEEAKKELKQEKEKKEPLN